MSGSVFRDRDGEFAAAYATGGVPAAAYLIRPATSVTAAPRRPPRSRTLTCDAPSPEDRVESGQLWRLASSSR